ncbi:MAG: hypothetical protein M1840_005342 [Geoglossum simile]|nr:MAG: hypothetical protein M1840_005342 [Geoglossum simile]
MPESIVTQSGRHDRRHRIAWAGGQAGDPPSPTSPASADPPSRTFRGQSEAQIAYMIRLEREAVSGKKENADLKEQVRDLTICLRRAEKRVEELAAERAVEGVERERRRREEEERAGKKRKKKGKKKKEEEEEGPMMRGARQRRGKSGKEMRIGF